MTASDELFPNAAENGLMDRRLFLRNTLLGGVVFAAISSDDYIQGR